jgi:hypothetical protein
MVIGIDGSVLRIRSEERERKRRSAVLVVFFWVDVVVVGRVMLQCLLLYIEEAKSTTAREGERCICICLCLRFSFFLGFLWYGFDRDTVGMLFQCHGSTANGGPGRQQLHFLALIFSFDSEASNSKKLSCVLPWSRAPCTCQVRLLSKLVPRALIARVRGLEG